MASYIKQFFDFLGNEVFPKTREKAVYDDNGIRLDNKMALLKNALTSTDQSTYSTNLNLFKELDKFVGATSIQTQNVPVIPQSGEYYYKVWNVGFSEATFTQVAFTGNDMYIRYFTQWASPQWSGWNKMIDTDDLIQSDTVSDASKPASSTVTKALNDKKLNYIVLPSGQNLDSIGSGVFVGTNLVNSPNTSYWYSILATDVGHAGTQMLFGISDSNVYIRRKQGGVWLSTWDLVYGDTSWQNATLTTNFETYTTGSNLVYRKIGNIVYVKGAVKPKVEINNLGNSTVIANLPVGYRPSNISVIQVGQGTGMNKWMLSINTYGDIGVSRYGITAEIAIPVGTWLPIDVSYVVG